MDVLFQELDVELQHLVHSRPVGTATILAAEGIFSFVTTLI